MARRSQPDYFPCPHCGEDVAAGATFCRACGASDEMGWDGEQWYDAPSDIEQDDDFDYDDYLAREFPEHATPRPASPRRWLAVAVILLLCLAILLWSVL